MGIRKFFRYLLPLAVIALSVVLVVTLVVIAKSKRPERKEAAEPATLVETIRAEKTSLNFAVYSQGSVQPRTETTLVAEVAGQKLVGKPARTGNWAEFRVVELGEVEFTQPGVQVVSIRPRDAASWKAINLRWVKLSARN